MATIGLYDADMAVYGSPFFNLELMKIASYYKNRRDIVVLSNRLIPSRFTRFFYYQNVYGQFPKALYQHRNLRYGGHAFSGEKYKPLPLEIEQLIPDKNIYSRFINSFSHDNYTHGIFKHQLAAHHLRASLDGETVWPDYQSQIELSGRSKVLIFHDYDIGKIKDIEKFLFSIPEQVHPDARVETKWPIKVYPGDRDWYKWFDLPWASGGANIEHQGFMSDLELADYADNVSDKKKNTRFTYNVSVGFRNEDEFFEKGLEKLLFQCIYAKQRRITLKIVSEPGFFSSQAAYDFLMVMTAFVESGKRYKRDGWFTQKENSNDTVYRFISNIVKKEKFLHLLTVERIRDAFELINRKNYKVFDGLYQQNSVVLRQGEIVDERWARNQK